MNYKEFQKTDDHALNIALAIEHCKRKGIRTLTFDKDTYVLRPQNASSRYLSISNHNVNEVTSVGFAIDGMQDFTIDGGGSTFICDGVMVTAAILHSQNVTFQNASFEVREHMRLETKVVANDDESFTVDPEQFISLGRATPFDGCELYGQCYLTCAHGATVYKR